MGQNIKVSKTVNDTVEGTIRKVVSAIKDLGLELKNVDVKNGTIKFAKNQWGTGAVMYSYQCVIFDLGDGSTMCTIQTIGYGPDEEPWNPMESIGIINSRKHSQKILDRL